MIFKDFSEVPHLHFFFAVVQKMHYFCAIGCKFSIIIEKNYTGTSPSKNAIWDEFSKQQSILTIAFSKNYLLRPNNFRKRATTIAVAKVGRAITNNYMGSNTEEKNNLQNQ